MVKRCVIFTFSQEMVQEPVIYTMSQQFNIITNIRRADISEDKGWAIVELEGNENDIEQGITWVTSRGARVDPADENFPEN
ncbi:MAG: NIL domain-containing protein [Dehalococcoidales bacterium]|nr:NIL domain-containing protein [Dehalococcoidales bacterium]MDP6824759.1 NIL domain-containing protein [Dehalococcoidales bacterium]